MKCVAMIMDQKQQKKKWKLPALLLGTTPPVSPVVPKAPAPARQLSGPPLIPKEARRKGKDASFMAREPTSPKISCMGQIQYTKKKKKKKTSVPKETKEGRNHLVEGGKDVNDTVRVMRWVPSLGEVKRLSSGRRSLSKIDMKAVQVVEEASDDIGISCGLDNYNKEEISVSHVDHNIIEIDVEAASRKEMNLWKRRSFNAPPHLQLLKPIVRC